MFFVYKYVKGTFIRMDFLLNPRTALGIFLTKKSGKDFLSVIPLKKLKAHFWGFSPKLGLGFKGSPLTIH